MSPADHQIDLHGETPDKGRIDYLLWQAVEAARRDHAGLRVIHGRGEGVMAKLVAELLEEWGLDFVAGWANPGETRLSPVAVQSGGRRR